MKEVLVTGGAGFVGSHVVDALLARGDRVRVLDDLSTGRRANLPSDAHRLSIVEGSILDAALVAEACAGADAIVHFAALPSVSRSVVDPVASHEVNATGTLRILDAARARRTRVIYAGSSSAYGDQDAAAKHEEMRERPLSPYAASKLAGELYCRAFARVYGLPVVVTRFFNVYGPRQVPDSPYSGVIAAFCHALCVGRAPRIEGDGGQARDFTYVSDVVRGVLLAVDGGTEGCHTVNLAAGGSHTILELLATLQEIAGTRLAPEFVPARRGDVRHSQADVRQAKALLGFSASVSFAEGLRRTYEWYRSKQA
ncbi:MAG: GDP-mannose 4,6-dehydratase [Planctomycetes bacterium]|nr:GDP-mannose 4,6-dehydratase [Planctomycetota bacterium]